MRKIFLLVFLTVNISVNTFFILSAEGAEWKYIDSDKLGKYYYDVENIIYPSENIVRVWIRYICDENTAVATQNLGIIKNIKKETVLLEINCFTREKKILSKSFYDSKGNLIYRLDSGESVEVQYMTPEATEEKLYKAVCPKKGKK